MLVTNKITVRLDDRQVVPQVDAVQCDANTRALELTLEEGGKAWTVPEGSKVSVAFRKADGKAGWYDTLPDGTKACGFSGNVVTAVLAPQVLTAWGKAEVVVIVQDPDTLDQIGAFPVTVEVARNPAAGKGISNDYFNYKTMAQINEAMEDMQAVVDNSGSYRGAVLAEGRTSFAECKLHGYYSFSQADVGSIGDLPEEIAVGGILVVEPSAAGGVRFQTIKTSEGELWFRWSSRTFRKIVPQLNANRVVSYRGNVIENGYTSFFECSLPGYYSFTKADIPSISDAPGGLSSGGTLEVRNNAASFQVFQTITDTAGRSWFRYANNAFVPSGSQMSVRWLALGDSITQGYYSDANGELKGPSSQCWAALVAKYNGWELTNEGVGGSGYVAVGTVGDKLNARDHLAGLELAGYDLITLAFGVNDWKYDKPLGSMEDDVETGGTLYSNMRWCIESVAQKAPAAKIVVISPINCCAYGEQATNWGVGHAFPNNGTLEDIFRAEQEVCAYYGVELVDLLHGSVVNRMNIQGMLPDGVHPSLSCHGQLAKEASRKIMG